MHDQDTIDALKLALERMLEKLHREVREEVDAEDPARYAELLDLMGESNEVRVAERAHEMGLASIRRHVAEMHEIEAALGRIHSGHYGLCADCGDSIPVQRLAAQPAATRCVECQTAAEGVEGGQAS
jgi:RNA polymerase-binding protein DksA